MRTLYPARSHDARLAASHAMSRGDSVLQLADENRERTLTGVVGRLHRKHDARDLAAGDGDATGPALEAAKRDAIRQYEEALHHYLNAASMYYAGVERARDETPQATFDRLPPLLRDALMNAYTAYHLDAARSTATDEEQLAAAHMQLESLAHFVAIVRNELQYAAPDVFGSHDTRTLGNQSHAW